MVKNIWPLKYPSAVRCSFTLTKVTCARSLTPVHQPFVLFPQLSLCTSTYQATWVHRRLRRPHINSKIRRTKGLRACLSLSRSSLYRATASLSATLFSSSGVPKYATTKSPQASQWMFTVPATRCSFANDSRRLYMAFLPLNGANKSEKRA